MVMRWVALTVAVVAAVGTHLALGLGQGYGVAIGLAALQAVAIGGALWGAVPWWRRWAGPVVAAALLAALAVGGRSSGPAALLAEAGVAHALLYTGLLVAFAATLRPGRTALVTRFARRLNPGFHAGMVPYTRAVTWAWCALFAGQLGASILLLAAAPHLWAALVTVLHWPLVAALAVGEFLVRRRRFRHERYTGLLATVRGVSAIARDARTSRPEPGCPVRSGNETPPLPPGRGSARGPAGR